MTKKKAPSKKQQPTQKVHPWRLCPLGRHWVREHPFHVKPSKRHPAGVTTRHGHCADNPSHKDALYPDEMNEIVEEHFSSLTGPPAAKKLGYKNGNDYDLLIRGWTQYWNDVLKPKEPLDPDLVKALIATESSFKKGTIISAGRGLGKARGLMQVTDQSQKALYNEKSELKDHFVHVNQKQMINPNLNIAAGIRWLFRKKQIVDSQAKRDVSWLDAIAKYKKYPRDSKKMKELEELYRKLKEK